ncbi:response regulator transcription factor [Flavihumibacter sp. ZG627]|uniref:response regulator n=1 Tax=Flavihumibacter sp. ZG627 TaxID=1463156 RepID=UPI00057CC8FC|nr:response regulator transcription factor [Flavihumibacter sp. ZG627]KIC90522.1 LuxR family transcriptional regulator [Flavihumibacter sp. ZG627]
MPVIKIVLVEDLEEVIEGLNAFIDNDTDLQLLAVYRTAEAASLEIPFLKPDIVIMDINLPGITGIECIRKLKQLDTAIQFMMFTVYENNDQVFEALKAGASGYLLKKTPPTQIIEAIKELYQGGSPMSAAIARKLLSVFQNQSSSTALPEAAKLSKREKEVLSLLSKGLLYKEIAQQLGISFHTVRQHICKIYEKLHVQNKTEAINKVYGNRWT